MKCKLCDKECNGQRGLASHLRQTHGIKTLDQYKEYYDTYILSEDIICPICKIHPRKFYSFKVGYAKTCIGQKDENGHQLNCRTHWANRDKEKARQNSIRVMKELKETPSEDDPSKSKFDVKYEKWYQNMSQKDNMGMTKFDVIGLKISKALWTINPKTGKTLAKEIGEKSRDTRINTVMSNGKTIAQNHTWTAARTVESTIMPDGRTKKEHMIDKANETRQEILPNGLTRAQDTAKRAYESKVENGTLPKYHGYSKISEQVFHDIVDMLDLDITKCFFGTNEKQIINEKEHKCHRYDFIYVNEYEYPEIIIEFQGNQYHLRETELETRKYDINPHGRLLIENYQNDVEKKEFIHNIYPECKFFYIWEDSIEYDIQKILDILSEN